MAILLSHTRAPADGGRRIKRNDIAKQTCGMMEKARLAKTSQRLFSEKITAT